MDNQDKNILLVDSGINDLANSGDVTEANFQEIIRRYNLVEGLFYIGNISNNVFNSVPNKDKDVVSNAIYRDPIKKMFVPQWGLAYLASSLILSGANDYKSKLISEKDNLLGFLNIYNNNLDGDMNDKSVAPGIMIRLYTEQIVFQFVGIHEIAKSFALFSILPQQIIAEDKDLPSLSSFFKEKTGLSLDEYLAIGFSVFAATGFNKNVSFRKEILTESTIESLKDYFTEDKVERFLKIYSCDYLKFRAVDEEINKNCLYPKTKLNPLWIYPIIKTDKPVDKINPYLIPNMSIFVKTVFSGLFWWFDSNFKAEGRLEKFRKYFGLIFEKYCGELLKQIYGDSLEEKIQYADKKKEFFDWIVQTNDDKYLLFECKAYQYSLKNKQSGNIEEIVEKEIQKKIAETFDQIRNRLDDIKKYPELSKFRDKTIQPIIVLLDFPFAGTNFYDDWLKEALDEYKKDSDYPEPLIINADDMGVFESVKDKIEMDEAIKQAYRDNSGFYAVISKLSKNGLSNQYLKDIFDKEFNRIMKVEP